MGEIINYIKSEIKEDIMLLHFDGSLLHDNINDVRKDFEKIIRIMVEKKLNVLAIDLGGVLECDSRGLGLLVKMKSQSVSLGFELVLYNLNTFIADLLELSTLGTLFKIMSLEDFGQKYLGFE